MRKISKKLYERIMSNPNISDYDKMIWQRDLEGKFPRGCYSFQYSYVPPKDTEAYYRSKKITNYGNHCFYVDKGVDKDSIDKMNLNKNIEVNWTCDGEHQDIDPENIEIGQDKPYHKAILGITYKGTDRKRLNRVLKSLCKTSNIFEHESGSNISLNHISKEENTFSISSKERNSKEWWISVADILDQLR